MNVPVGHTDDLTAMSCLLGGLYFQNKISYYKKTEGDGLCEIRISLEALRPTLLPSALWISLFPAVSLRLVFTLLFSYSHSVVSC